ncbi:GTP pyrophosphokinase [Echinicola rosea]|uniref:(P)ppGpp synthetase n=1 Tax=Echinicola rosea TaxID=1807691 RepID=A0ABQ1VB00_9BACT|nr:(p)ppGpp synthetase [Echinicola rosea]GGF50417.1 (p)ppGpp synthetase [Echinicola rosea]
MNEIDKNIQEFKIWYENELPHHNAAVNFFCQLIGAIPKVELVKGRTKSYEECISKFTRKYLPYIDKKEKEVIISNYLTDLIGIRAVCFYAEEVYEIRRGLRKYFKELEITDKSSQLEKTEDKFGYKSLHLKLVLKRGLKGIDNAGKFNNIQIELQVRTVIQDAWSVLDHKIKYKKSIPQGLKRRINRLSALFEIADEEFSNIQKEILKEENKINYRLKKGGRIETLKTLDVFRFLFVALKYFPNYDFSEFKVDGFVQEILLLKSDFTEGALNKALQENLSHVDTIEKSINQHLNPYTKIRYCLYKSNIEKFKTILSEHQQGIFDTLD